MSRTFPLNPCTTWAVNAQVAGCGAATDAAVYAPAGCWYCLINRGGTEGLGRLPSWAILLGQWLPAQRSVRTASVVPGSVVTASVVTASVVTTSALRQSLLRQLLLRQSLLRQLLLRQFLLRQSLLRPVLLRPSKWDL